MRKQTRIRQMSKNKKNKKKKGKRERVYKAGN